MSVHVQGDSVVQHPEHRISIWSYQRATNNVFALFGLYLMRRSNFVLTSTGERMLALGKLTQKTINVKLREDEVEDINPYLEVLASVGRQSLAMIELSCEEYLCFIADFQRSFRVLWSRLRRHQVCNYRPVLLRSRSSRQSRRS
jgi:hypothetical protein